jgi:hypothetical protein
LVRTAGFELELARTLLSYGEVLAADHRRDEALQALAEARTIFDRHGAKPALARTLLLKAKIRAGR